MGTISKNATQQAEADEGHSFLAAGRLAELRTFNLKALQSKAKRLRTQAAKLAADLAFRPSKKKTQTAKKRKVPIYKAVGRLASARMAAFKQNNKDALYQLDQEIEANLNEQEKITKELSTVEALLKAINPANLRKLAAIAKQDKIYNPVKGLTPEHQKIFWKRLSCNDPMFLPPEVALAVHQHRDHAIKTTLRQQHNIRQKQVEGGHHGGDISAKNRIAMRGDCIENHRIEFDRLCKTMKPRSAAINIAKKTKNHFDSITRHFRQFPTPPLPPASDSAKT